MRMRWVGPAWWWARGVRVLPGLLSRPPDIFERSVIDLEVRIDVDRVSASGPVNRQAEGHRLRLLGDLAAAGHRRERLLTREFLARSQNQSLLVGPDHRGQELVLRAAPGKKR